jgi:hypothetical protein
LNATHSSVSSSPVESQFVSFVFLIFPLRKLIIRGLNGILHLDQDRRHPRLQPACTVKLEQEFAKLILVMGLDGAAQVLDQLVLVLGGVFGVLLAVALDGAAGADQVAGGEVADAGLEAVGGETPFHGLVANHGVDDAVVGFDGHVVVFVEGGEIGVLGE